jgi:hypothetical protein
METADIIGPEIKEEVKTKKCITCKETKPLSEFGKRKDMSDGHDIGCRICRATKSREYYNKRIEKRKLSTTNTNKDPINETMSLLQQLEGFQEPVIKTDLPDSVKKMQAAYALQMLQEAVNSNTSFSLNIQSWNLLINI